MLVLCYPSTVNVFPSCCAIDVCVIPIGVRVTIKATLLTSEEPKGYGERVHGQRLIFQEPQLG